MAKLRNINDHEKILVISKDNARKIIKELLDQISDAPVQGSSAYPVSDDLDNKFYLMIMVGKEVD